MGPQATPRLPACQHTRSDHFEAPASCSHSQDAENCVLVHRTLCRPVDSRARAQCSGFQRQCGISHEAANTGQHGV